ncbi:hypothetical protein F5Y02DRAFT_415935 [Annulohypoxylon stygium]|nr:hypothetical protein F5Y02DRAFT_415935 [Annulohypoxylon stygium]
MADHAELELKTFEISSIDSNVSLSVTSLALISNIPLTSYSSEDIFQLVQSKQLWLISPGLCRIQISVRQDQFSMASIENDVRFLEHLADAICQCALWSALGLTIKQEDIQYEPLYDGAPNLYFIVEHPQKSSLLLSPPHSPTAHFNGIECLFRYQSDSSNIPSNGENDTFDTDKDGRSPQAYLQFEDLSPNSTSYDDEMFNNRWDDAAYLAQMALHVTVGIKKRLRGLRLFQLDNRPALLELAPAIWNARYLEAVASHVANFPTISNILATSTRAQSLSLRQKSAKLLTDDARHRQYQDHQESVEDLNVYRNSAHQRLWGLLQAALRPMVGIKNADLTANLWESRNSENSFEFMSTETDGFEDPGIDPDNMIDGTSSDDVSFDGFSNSDRPLPTFLEYQIGDANSEFDMAIEYQQWWHWGESIHTGSAYDTQATRPEKFNHSDSLPRRLSSSSRELLDESIIHQYSSNDLMESTINGDDIYSSSDLYNDGVDYDTLNEPSYRSESIPRDDSHYTDWTNEAIMDGNRCTRPAVIEALLNTTILIRSFTALSPLYVEDLGA